MLDIAFSSKFKLTIFENWKYSIFDRFWSILPLKKLDSSLRSFDVTDYIPALHHLPQNGCFHFWTKKFCHQKRENFNFWILNFFGLSVDLGIFTMVGNICIEYKAMRYAYIHFNWLVLFEKTVNEFLKIWIFLILTSNHNLWIISTT